MTHPNVRVGIVTHHWVANFGANLQALASLRAFEAQGANAEILDYREPGWDDRIRAGTEESQWEQHENFMAQNFRLSPRLASIEELREHASNHYDLIVVGSDAMFALESRFDPFTLARCLRRRLPLPPQDLPGFWLPWPQEEGQPKRATLSVSAMGTTYPLVLGRLRAEAKEALTRFDHLAVRDDWTLAMVNAFGGTHAHLSPDPVFSLKPRLEPPATLPYDLSDTILVSGGLRQEWVTAFAEAAKRKGYRVAGIRIPEKSYQFEGSDFDITEPLDPLTWFWLLNSAAGYVGVRFHALVTSMVHGKPVINVDPHRKSDFLRSSSKMFDLCNRAGTPERFFTLRSLARTPPAQVLELLFDEHALAAANTYSAGAQSTFDNEIKAILNLV